MGFMAPTPSDQLSIVVTALVSYNRPVIFLGCFLVVFAATYLFTKKNALIAFLVSAILTLLLIVFFTISALSSVRY